MAADLHTQLGLGVSSLTFGVALAVFIYAAPSALGSAQALLLFAASFLLMLRFWWRYNELFVRSLPSSGFWHFLFDFLVSFFGIAAVLAIGNIQAWAALGALAMLASMARCGLSWRGAGKVKPALRRTLAGAAGMLVIFLVIIALAQSVSALALSAAAFLIVLAFVAYSARKQ